MVTATLAARERGAQIDAVVTHRLDDLFRDVTDVVYGQLWAGCSTQPTLARAVELAAVLPSDAEKVRAVYARVMQRVVDTGVAVLPLSLEVLTPVKLAELAQAETLYKFFAVFVAHEFEHVQPFFDGLQGDLCARAAAIASWMEEHKHELARILELRLSGHALTRLPPQIGLFSGLRQLSLFHNNLEEIPAEIGRCASLTILHLVDNQLTALPAEIRQCTWLRCLELSSNRFSVFPREVLDCAELRHLDLVSNQIPEIPAGISQLVRLETLLFSANRLTTISAGIRQCTALSHLGLDRNQITEIPGWIAECARLRLLALSRNLLTAIPRELANCPELRVLFLDHNQIAAIPPELGHCPALRRLVLANNRLTHIPEELRQCVTLDELDVRNNQIAQTRAELRRILPGIQEEQRLLLHGNPTPPPGCLERLWIWIQETLLWPLAEWAARLWTDLRRQITA